MHCLVGHDACLTNEVHVFIHFIRPKAMAFLSLKGKS